MKPSLKPWGLGLAWALLSAAANADIPASMQAVHRDWMAPRAADLSMASARLTDVLTAYCAGAGGALAQPRQAWRDAVDRWERLSAVAIGPVLEQRIQRRIDFIPTRPRLIVKAIKSAPANSRDMELIGTPAKGLPGLEWLLWVEPIQPATPACSYAVLVAGEIAMEARGIERGYQQAASQVLDADAARIALGELVNQWVGGLERLRWANMEMPLRVAGTAGPHVAPEYPRQISGDPAAGWAAQWDLLSTLAAGPGPGSLAALLRQRGKDGLAAALTQGVARAGAAMAGLTATDKDRILQAAGALATLRYLVENEVAPALEVSIGFSDSDGD